jgi:putative methyltransferase (TIGR04325 family)
MRLSSVIRRAKRAMQVDRQPAKTDLHGDFATWNAARAASTGYDSESILEKTRLAVLRVTKGQAAFERDSLAFDQIEHNWPVLSAVMFGAARSSGNLNVVDVGGSLGSTYFQMKAFLDELEAVQWNIIEQPRHVEVGKTWFEGRELRFFSSLEECLGSARPKVALLSSVLQYLEEPESTLSTVFASDVDTVIVDRTPFWDGDRHRLCVQVVPAHIYEASYPSWIFSRRQFDSHVPGDWHKLATFPCSDSLSGPVELTYEGMILVRKTSIRESGMRNSFPPAVDQS